VDVETVITELKVGEALVSLLQPDGSPSPVERTMIRPPQSRLGPVSAQERGIFLSTSAVAGKYEERVDRESAEEILKARAQAAAEAVAEKKAAKAEVAAEKEEARAARHRKANRGIGEEMALQLGKSVQRQVVNRIAGSLVRGLLGGLFKGR
jgi:hypothetical protein